MSSRGSTRDSARFVSLFQKAHAHVAHLQKVDEQIASLFEQRRRSLEDLKAVQSQINNEFQRLFELERIVPANLLSDAPAFERAANMHCESSGSTMHMADALPSLRAVAS